MVEATQNDTNSQGQDNEHHTSGAATFCPSVRCSSVKDPAAAACPHATRENNTRNDTVEVVQGNEVWCHRV